MEEKTQRNYTVVGLVPHEDCFTVLVHVRGDAEPHDSGTRCTGFGEFGLTRAERAIVNQGITATGNDRIPNNHKRGRPRKKTA